MPQGRLRSCPARYQWRRLPASVMPAVCSRRLRAGRDFNTAAVGLASSRLAETYRAFIGEWAADGLDYTRGERAAGEARSAVARLIGADAADIALIPSASAAAGLVAAQFGPAGPGEHRDRAAGV
jgi:selenocysteine lyase/cysteine desulfurase